MITPARLAYTSDGTPYSTEYDDVYHSAAGGLEQARHVFLAGNGLLGNAARWCGAERFVIVETGFGLGLNFLATWQAWREDAQRCRCLQFISFERHPLGVIDLATAHACWPELAELSGQLRNQWPSGAVAGAHRIEFANGRVVLSLYFGDAEETLSRRMLTARADAFFLDGFSPARNPALWTPSLFKLLAELSVPGATLATWTVAGAVRQGLAAAGFVVTKVPGFGNKREMLKGAWAGA